MKLFPLPEDPLLRRRYLIIGTVILVLVVAAVSYLVLVALNRRQPVPNISTEPSPTAPTSSSETTLEPSSPSPSPSKSATASPTASAVTLPDSVKKVLANFYGAYSQRDAIRLNSFFTADTDPDIKDMRSTLFTGKGSDGTYMGGPVLFATNNVSEYVKSYAIKSSSQQRDNWVVVITEKRVDPDKHEFTATTQLALVPGATDSWLIDSYVHVGSSGKYNGFFTE